MVNMADYQAPTYQAPTYQAPTFDRDLQTVAGRVDEIGPLVRRVLAPNPSAFTFLGTGTYIVGSGTVAVIDPGPANAAHIDALVEALRGETVSHIVCTHTHSDHSPGSRLLQAAVGGRIVGCAPHPAGDVVAFAAERAAVAATEHAEGDSKGDIRDAEPGHSEDHFDADHVPADELFDGDVIDGPGWSLEAVHTPGHIANHLCFALREASVLFSGDHVMAWSTSVVSPPTGNLNDYLRSLDKVRLRTEQLYWPTHGPAVKDPRTFVSQLYAHREHRTAQILSALTAGPQTIPPLVAQMYIGLDEKLVPAAGRSVLAHVIALRQREKVASSDDLDNKETIHSLM
jgi:glyoxylase-like metal-dependent hydrolase (beta-lactamase superfamily II)